MSDRPKIVKAVIDERFKPINAGKAARRQLFVSLGTALLLIAALTIDGPLMWALWAWVAWRGSVLVALFAVGPQIADELAERLAAIPPQIRRVLDGSAE